MTLRAYLILMSAAAALCWAAWGAVLYAVDPAVTNWVGFALFYTSFFLSVLGTASVLGFLIRFVALKRALAWKLAAQAFRQSFLIAILLTISLLLIARDLFTWLSVSFLVVGLIVLEFFLLGYERPASSHPTYDGVDPR